jgi:putative membrane protein
MRESKNKAVFISTLILVIVYMTGIIGMQTSHKEWFLAMTPLNLLLSTGLLLFHQSEYNKTFISFLIITFITGFFIEVAGVNTGIIFGSYHYGDTLGPKLFETPMIIGLNWMMLVYAAGVISNKLKTNKFIRSAVGAALLLILDLVLEPVAVKYDFWSWEQGIIPFRNYVAWYLVSYLLLLIFHSITFNKENKLAQPLYIIQLVFFVLLCNCNFV